MTPVYQQQTEVILFEKVEEIFKIISFICLSNYKKSLCSDFKAYFRRTYIFWNFARVCETWNKENCHLQFSSQLSQCVGIWKRTNFRKKKHIETSFFCLDSIVPGNRILKVLPVSWVVFLATQQRIELIFAR